MKVLVSDKLGDAGIAIFQNEDGIEVDVNTGLSPEELKAIIGQYDALVVRSATKVTPDLLEAATNLRVIGRAGIGVDNIDVEEATKRGIVVMNTPKGNVVTTAEHAIAMMMSLTRNIPRGTALLKEGRWEKKKLQGREIGGKVLGVIGYGKIGSIVANRAKGLKMKVMIYDPVVNPEKIEKAGFENAPSLEVLYRNADYITVHVPKMKKTIGLVNKAAFDQMKDGVRLINCSRGGIVDETALCEALESGKVAGAALDVFETEPPPADHPLLKFNNVVVTPHLGASTLEAQTNVAVAVAKQIINFLKNDTIENALNTAPVSCDVLEKLAPFLYLAEKIGRLNAQMITGRVREVDIEYNGDFADADLAPMTTAFLTGLLEPIVMDDVNMVNARFLAKEKGVKVWESSSSDAAEYVNLMTCRVVTDTMTNSVSGTVFGVNYPRIVKINDFRLEMEPEGNLTLVYNMNVPGEIGKIGNILGTNDINISDMTVGQARGDNNIVFFKTDTPLNAPAIEQLESMPNSRTVLSLQL